MFRGSEFVTKKIVENIVEISKGNKEFFELGNIYAKRDWGFAGDYVEAMYLMLQQDIPQDFVISTGETHTIKEFIEKSFEYINNKIEWVGEGLDEVAIDKNGSMVVKINPEYFRPSEVDLLIGDSTKAKELLGWESKYKFNDLIKHMMDYELKKVI
jgi:GDPmannose 4,6-dehydratase